MTRANRNRTENTDTATETTEGAPEGTENATTESAAADTADRGDVGVVTIRPSTREITSVRTRTSNDPIHLAVRDAVRGSWYDIEVDNDPTKIERVNRKLRAAAQKYDVGMNIHPDHPASETEGKVIVSFRTGERDKRAKTENPATTGDTATNEGDTAATPAE